MSELMTATALPIEMAATAPVDKPPFSSVLGEETEKSNLDNNFIMGKKN